ncbi:MAG: Replicative DNA helicase [Planctomycetes bacterium]|nr:Replicative DNA helicase [Planctomycetota bacterium]
MPDAGYIPPHSIEAEQAVLGCMFVDPSCIDAVRLALPDPAMFWRHSHQVIYRAILQLHDNDLELDWITCADAVEHNHELEACGGRDALQTYLADISNSVPSSYGVQRWAAIIQREWRRRELVLVAGDARAVALDGARQDPAGDAVDLLERELTRLDQSRQHAQLVPIDEAVAAAESQREQVEEWRRANEGALPGLSSGWSDLDQLTLGFRGGELIVVGARPSQGKTACLLGMASHFLVNAAQAGETVLIFSYEMGTVELAQRVICQVAGVDQRNYRLGKLDYDERGAVLQATNLIRPAAYIVDNGELRLPAVRSIARGVARKHKLKAILLDYLQLVPDDNALDRHLQIGNISRGLKAMARELDIPVITAAQLNRGVEHRSEGRPKLSDLRESGSIEQDADQVLLLHRTTPDKEKDELEVLEYSFLLEKNRNGPTGGVPMYFHKTSARFVQRSAVRSAIA